jgi:predicted N-acyltransferase
MADQEISLRVYESIDEVDRDEWAGVVDAASAPVFYDYRFLRAYERAPLQETEAFFYLTFGKPAVAVLPAYIQSTDDPLGILSALDLPGRAPGDRILLTHIAHCYDTGLPVRPGQPAAHLAEQACAALADLAGQAGVRWIGFLNVDGCAPMAGGLTAAGLTKLPMNTRFRRDLTRYATVEEFVTDIPSAKARRALRTSRHQAHRAGLEVIPMDPMRGAAGAVEMCRRTTARHGTAEYYPQQFHEFVPLAADLITVTEVRLRGRVASASVCLSDRTRFHLWAGGIDYEVTEGIHSAFALMLWSGLDKTIQQGRSVIEAGRGNAAAKLRFRLEPIPLFAFVGRA